MTTRANLIRPRDRAARRDVVRANCEFTGDGSMTLTNHAYRRATALLLVCAISIASIEGCSTVSVVAAQASKADDTFTTTRISLWWGANDAVENVDCKGNGLQIVSV